MEFPKSLHAEAWPEQGRSRGYRQGVIGAYEARRMPAGERGADAISPPPRSRRWVALALVVAIAALAAIAGVNLAVDPRPLDEQWNASVQQADETLQDWQPQLAGGLQVSLRAVADGSELLRADAGSTHAADAEDAAATADPALRPVTDER
jgi:hypothetical protein